jgi:hypothetical protein
MAERVATLVAVASPGGLSRRRKQVCYANALSVIESKETAPNVEVSPHLIFSVPLTSRLPPPRAGLHQFARFVKVTARSSLAPLTYARIIIDITDMMFVLVLYLHT